MAISLDMVSGLCYCDPKRASLDYSTLEAPESVVERAVLAYDSSMYPAFSP